MSDAPARKKLKRELWLLAFVVVAPVVASYFAYYVWRPNSFKNYGDLLPPTPIPVLAVDAPAPSAPELAGLKGKWVLLMVDRADCDPKCREKLWQMRQLRLTQGKEMDRIARAWVVSDGRAPDAALLAEFEGTVVLGPAVSDVLTHPPAPESEREHLYLIDPLGNLMMRFPKDADPNRIKKDLTHLLKVSRVG
jgi:hypothetical protein